LLVGGIKYPEVSAAAGLVFLLGRWVYAINYVKGDPSKRNRGDFYYLGLFTLLGTAVASVYDLLRN
jgi:glutathione S-transferase